MARRSDHRSELPLLAWGDQLRADKHKRRRLGRRIAITGAAIAILGLTMAFPPSPRFVWNASASAPVGLYGVTPGSEVDPGDMVIAWLPDPWRALAASRRYLPANVPLVKRVAAGPGDEICALGTQIVINGRWAAKRVAADPRGRPMPWWSGCVRLRGHQFFLLMARSPASFDGRYFGLTEGSQIIGKAHPLWTH